MTLRAKKKRLVIGKTMKDGTVYAGRSPDTGRAMYALPYDSALTIQWKNAMELAPKIEKFGHKDYRVPSKGELAVLFKNRAAIGGFTESLKYSTSCYCSSDKKNDDYIYGQRFSDGAVGSFHREVGFSLRCVRG